jgi:L-gulonate 5-dehydrogenase
MRTFGVHVDGALTERIAVPVRLLHEASGLTGDLAALAEPMSIGLHAVARSGLARGDDVVVFGAGPIGQAILLACTERGARVLVTDVASSRLALARELGADATHDSRDGDLARSVAAWTSDRGPTVVFEATGVPAVLATAIDLVAASGTVVVVGVSQLPVTVPMLEFTRKELTVVGSRNSKGEFGNAIAFVRANRDRVARLISHRFPFDRAVEALELSAAGRVDRVMKVMIAFGAP